MIPAQTILAALSGAAVGFSLGLIGGGGSILALPLLIYVVGLKDPHIAIGTSALAVSANAFVNLIGHWRAGTVKWPCAILFSAGGVAGAALGSSLGKAVDGEKLLVLFALVMIAAGIVMLRPRKESAGLYRGMTPIIAARLVGLGFAAGLLSGFFGIGGGFLVVPGLMLGSGIPILNAIGSSLFSVGVFGLTTATNYALSGLVAWRVGLEFLAGGAIGGYFGMRTAIRLSNRRNALAKLFAGLVFAVAAYILWRSLAP